MSNLSLDRLSTAELRLVNGKLKGLLFDHPQMANISALSKEIEKRLEAAPDKEEGERLLALAEKHGLEDGYAAPEDYFFFARDTTITWPPDKKGQKYTDLLLCFKFEWFLNGRAYDPGRENVYCRNFHDFIPDGYEDDGEYTCTAAELRAALIKAGLEEKPEMEGFYEEYCKRMNARHHL